MPPTVSCHEPVNRTGAQRQPQKLETVHNQIQQNSGNRKEDGQGWSQAVTALQFSQHFISQVLSQLLPQFTL